jgi:hypothetical protein
MTVRASKHLKLVRCDKASSNIYIYIVTVSRESATNPATEYSEILNAQCLAIAVLCQCITACSATRSIEELSREAHVTVMMCIVWRYT